MTTEEQRQRLHKLAKLGGLVVIAGLDNLAPELLLGCLYETAKNLATFSESKLNMLHQTGAVLLQSRNTSRRVDTSASAPSCDIKLAIPEIKKLYKMCNKTLPALEKDIIPEFLRWLRSAS